jgi:alpha-galactosidase
MVCAWAFVKEDETEVLLTAVYQETHGNMLPVYVRLRGLSAGSIYEDAMTGQTYPSDALMEAGIPLPSPGEEYAACTLHLKRTK